MNKLSPFKWFCLQNFPFIEADFDALTNYELMCKIVEYLNKTIAKTNELGNQVEVLTNWFNNLDVQDEIDHKLDEMAESGELEEIITAYLQVSGILCYNNVADMKQATNLIDGSFAEVLGYHTINDGGRAIYKVRTITNEDIVDEATIIALSNESLVAELIHENEINVMNFGCYGDGEHDDTLNFQKAIDYATSFANTVSTTGINEKEQITIISPQNKIYKISDTLTFTQTHVGLNMHNSVIYGVGAITMLSFGTQEHAVYYTNFKNLHLKADEDVNIGIYIHGSWNTYENIWIGGEITSTKKFQEYAIYTYNSWDNYFYNVQMYDIAGDGLYSYAANSTTYARCTAHRVAKNSFIIQAALSVNFTDCDIGFSYLGETSYGILLKSCYSVTVQNCYFEHFRNGICLADGTRSVNIVNSYYNFAHSSPTADINKKAIILQNCGEININAFIENSGSVGDDTNDVGIYYDSSNYTCNNIKIDSGSVFHNSWHGTKYSSDLTSIVKFEDFASAKNVSYAVTEFHKNVNANRVGNLDNPYLSLAGAIKKGRMLEKTLDVTSISSGTPFNIKIDMTSYLAFTVKILISLSAPNDRSITTMQELTYTGSFSNNSLVGLKRTHSDNYGTSSSTLALPNITYDSTNHQLVIPLLHSGSANFDGFAHVQVLCDTATNIS